MWYGLVVVAAMALLLWPQCGSCCRHGGHGVVVAAMAWFGGGCGCGVVVAVGCCYDCSMVFGIVEVAVFLAMGLFCFCSISLIVVIFAVSSVLFCSCFQSIIVVNAVALFLWYSFFPGSACSCRIVVIFVVVVDAALFVAVLVLLPPHQWCYKYYY